MHQYIAQHPIINIIGRQRGNFDSRALISVTTKQPLRNHQLKDFGVLIPGAWFSPRFSGPM